MKLIAYFRNSATAAIMICLIILNFTATAWANEVIKVASLYAFSGIGALSQELSIKGVRSGVSEINSRGGVLGKKLMLVELDTKSTPIGAKVAADKAVKDNVVAIIGSAWSSHTLPAAKVAQAAGVPLITNISTFPGITDIGDYIFRVCFTDLFQGRVMAQFARMELKAATAVVFENLNSDFSMSLSREFCSNFEKLGGEVLLRTTYKDRQDDYSQIIEQAVQGRPDVLFIPGYDESGVIIAKAHAAGLTAIPLGGDGWDMPDFFIKSAGKATGGYYCTHWSKEMDSEPSRYFVNKYYPYSQNDIGTAPAALAYDAVLLLADAIQRAGSTDRSAIRQALAATRDFKGVTGTISFQGKGDPNKSAVIMKIVPDSAILVKSISPE
jgi:branched-chain amino acid transport system substrate-binding protein